MNNYIVIGNIVKDLELKYTNSNKAVVNFTIAVNDREEVDFIECVAFGTQAENLCKYQGKGSKVAIQGKIKTRMYEYEGQKRKQWNVMCYSIEYLQNKATHATNGTQQHNYSTQQENATQGENLNGKVNALDDELPF